MKNNKGIKIMYSINHVVFFLTLGLFITIYFGFLAELFLGGVQVLSSLLLIFYWNRFSKKVKEKMINYWVVTAVYLLLWLFDWNFMNELVIMIVGVGIIPMGIAAYFLKILGTIKRESQPSQIEEIGSV